jgi:hypothetical protein
MLDITFIKVYHIVASPCVHPRFNFTVYVGDRVNSLVTVATPVFAAYYSVKLHVHFTDALKAVNDTVCLE